MTMTFINANCINKANLQGIIQTHKKAVKTQQRKNNMKNTYKGYNINKKNHELKKGGGSSNQFQRGSLYWRYI